MGFVLCLHQWDAMTSLGPASEIPKQAQLPRLPLAQDDYTSPPDFFILVLKAAARQAKCCEGQASCVALNRQEVTAIPGVTQAAFHFLLLREHRTAQTCGFPFGQVPLFSGIQWGELCKASQLHCTEQRGGIATDY